MRLRVLVNGKNIDFKKFFDELAAEQPVPFAKVRFMTSEDHRLALSKTRAL